MKYTKKVFLAFIRRYQLVFWELSKKSYLYDIFQKRDSQLAKIRTESPQQKKIGKFYQEIAWIEIDNTNQQISGESLSPGKTWKLEMYESLTFFKWENICLQGE